MKTNVYTITHTNIESESYFNCVRLSDLTGYANPVSAIQALNREGIKTEWKVMKDECGNIIKLA
jgi:hypothetical protein